MCAYSFSGTRCPFSLTTWLGGQHNVNHNHSATATGRTPCNLKLLTKCSRCNDEVFCVFRVIVLDDVCNVFAGHVVYIHVSRPRLALATAKLSRSRSFRGTPHRSRSACRTNVSSPADLLSPYLPSTRISTASCKHPRSFVTRRHRSPVSTFSSVNSF